MHLTFQPPIFFSDESFYVSDVKKTDIFFESEVINLSDSTLQIRPTEDVLNGIKEQLVETIILETRTWFAQKFTVQTFLKRFQFEFSNFSYDIVNRWVKIKWIPKALKIKSTSFILVFVVDSVTDCNPRIPSTFLEPLTPKAQSPINELEVQDLDTIPIVSTYGSMALHIPNSEEIKSSSVDKESYDRAMLKSAIARMKVAKLEVEYIKKYGPAKKIHSESDWEEEDSDSESKTSNESSELEDS